MENCLGQLCEQHPVPAGVTSPSLWFGGFQRLCPGESANFRRRFSFWRTFPTFGRKCWCGSVWYNTLVEPKKVRNGDLPQIPLNTWDQPKKSGRCGNSRRACLWLVATKHVAMYLWHLCHLSICLPLRLSLSLSLYVFIYKHVNTHVYVSMYVWMYACIDVWMDGMVWYGMVWYGMAM